MGYDSNLIILRGPFTVDFDTPGVNESAVTLMTLPEGAQVLRVWAYQTTPWVNAPEDEALEVTVDLVDAALTLGESGPEVYRVTSVGSGDNFGHLELVDPFIGLNDYSPKARVARSYAAGSRLDAFIYVNGTDTPESGSLDFYAIIVTPPEDTD